VLEVNYIANKGTRLPSQGFDDLNALPASVLDLGDIVDRPWTAASGIPQPFPGFSGSVAQALRPFPQYAEISQPYSNFGHSSYQSGQLQLTRHFSEGLAILGAYTWSKSIGMGAGGSAIDSDPVANSFDRRLERSITAFHVPHFAKLTWIYELPIGPGKAIPLSGILNTLLGGWQLTGNHQWRSGDALAISTSGIVSPIGTVRPDLVTGVDIITNSDAPINFRGISGGTTYLDRAAFANPPVHPGGRNVLTRPGTVGPRLPNVRGPAFYFEDLGMQKTFQFDEHRSFELRGTFLNAFNRHGRGNPITNITDPNFGQITGARFGGRNIELSARIRF
jgi:hypothetical protein